MVVQHADQLVGQESVPSGNLMAGGRFRGQARLKLAAPVRQSGLEQFDDLRTRFRCAGVRDDSRNLLG